MIRFITLLVGVLVVSTSFSQCDFISVVITTNSADWGDEMSWELLGPNSFFPTEQGAYQGSLNNTSTTDSLCLEPGCYAFNLYDSWGDGWNGGSINVELPDTTFSVFMTDGLIAYATFEINTISSECGWSLLGCTDVNAVNFTVGATVDDGSCNNPVTFTTSEQVEREYFLYIPNNLPADAPLVFVLHGYYGGALEMSSFCGMNEIANAEGFAVCYPQGLLDIYGIEHWNANLTGLSEVNDILFLTELAEYLQSSQGFDPDCTYSCGYSNGGYMSYTLACEAPDLFRGIGSVGGTMSGYDYTNCEVSLVPVVHLHGTMDEDIVYTATAPDPLNPWNGAAGVEDIVQMWADGNNTTETSVTPLPDIDPTDGSTVDVIKHTGGDFGYQAWLYRVNGGGHDWFGAWGNMDIQSSAEIWAFWSQFCGTTIDVESILPVNAQLFKAYNSPQSQQIEIQGLENCSIHIFDGAGKLISIKSVYKGSTTIIPIACSGFITIIARGIDYPSSTLSIQREKIIIQ